MPKTLTFILLLALTLLTGCKHTLNRSEADRSLKVLNSNIVNLITNASDNPEQQALHFLMAEPSSPIYLLRTNNMFSSDSVNNIGAHSKGEYIWNQEEKTFVKQNSSNKFEFKFPVGKQKVVSAEFLITEYKNENCKNHVAFPVLMDAKILIEQMEKLTIRHRAEIKDNFPLKIHSSIKGEDYQSDFVLSRTREGNKGSIMVNFSVLTNGFVVCRADIKTKIEYTRDGYYFTYFNFDINLFDHQIKGDIDYAKIDPTSGKYIDLFNENSEIIVTEGYGKKVGNIVLGLSGDGELLDYYIKFNNSDKILLSNYIPLMRKVLDYKY